MQNNQTTKTKVAGIMDLLHGGCNAPASDDARKESEAIATEAVTHEDDDYTDDSPVEGDLTTYISSIIHEDVKALYLEDYIEKMAKAVVIIDGDTPMVSTVQAVHDIACNRRVVSRHFA